MTPQARRIVRNTMYRLAVEYGDATAEVIREHGDTRSEDASQHVRARIWQRGCYLGWKQLQILFDTGNIVNELEEVIA